MCGIVGAFWLTSDAPNKSILRRMVGTGLTVLKNRGPDESSITDVSDYCVLGGNRLAIRCEPGSGSMPFRDDYNICFYNGEIYNYRRWMHSAASDGEIILPLYREEGVTAFSLMDGEFAISIWDEDRQCVFLVRDPFGTKPLYFSLNENRLLWASSASAIAAMDAHPYCAKVSSPVEQHTTSVQEPYTSFSGIWLIPPGHFLMASPSKVSLHRYHSWMEVPATAVDPSAVYLALEHSLTQRFDYEGVVAIPMSGGVDSGIIAFYADRLGINYHVFSVIEMFGQETSETETIYRRLDRLKRPAGVTLLKCNEKEYQDALGGIFAPDYYDYETFDNGNIPIHTVFSAIHKQGIRVAIDGGGGDELFHGYKFRDDFGPVPDWPRTWVRSHHFYSLYTTLLAWTAKSDRAGAHFSIETRFPYQSVELMNEASKLSMTNTLKWPLRQFLLSRLEYGSPLPLDLEGKEGFSLKNRAPLSIMGDMRAAWCRANNLVYPPAQKPRPFPFEIGADCSEFNANAPA